MLIINESFDFFCFIWCLNLKLNLRDGGKKRLRYYIVCEI